MVARWGVALLLARRFARAVRAVRVVASQNAAVGRDAGSRRHADGCRPNYFLQRWALLAQEGLEAEHLPREQPRYAAIGAEVSLIGSMNLMPAMYSREK